MNSKPFVPTEEELVSLGFRDIGPRKWFSQESGISYDTRFGFEIHTVNDGMSVYPKSLEELKCLISMMNQ